MVLSCANPKSQSRAQSRVWMVAARPAPAHFAPGKESHLFAPGQVILLVAAPAVMDHIPSFSLAHSLLLKVKFSRAAGAPGWFPAVLVEECSMKKAYFSDF